MQTASATQSVPVTLTQAGTVHTVEVLTLGVSGLDYADVGGGSCNGSPTLGVGLSCTVMVHFTPRYPGQRLGAVVLLDPSSTVLGTEYLNGTGAGALGVFVPGTAATVAGDGVFTSLGDGGLATQAGLRLPFGVAVDGGGNLFIADSGEYRIRRVDATQVISTYAGDGTESYTGDGGLATSATMGTPAGLVLDGAGNLYFADSTEHVVRRIDAVSKIITTVAGTGTHGNTGDNGPAAAATLYAPYGVTVDGSGNLYIADTANGKIRRVDAVTHFITTVAGNPAASVLGDGGPATSAMLNQPYSVVLDASGNLYIADAGNNRIRRVDASSHIITTVVGNGTQGFEGDGGAPTAAELYFPTSIAFDPAGNMYIADTQNNRIRKIVNGVIYTVVGNGTGKYAGDGGSAALAGIYGPFFVYLDATGNLYIGDYFDNRIREVGSAVVLLIYPNAIRVGQKSPPQSQGVENDGNATLSFSSIVPDTNAATDPATTTCSISSVLAVDADCLVGAEFAPTNVGSPIQGNILLNGNAGDSPLHIAVLGQSLALNTTNVSLLSNLNPSSFGQSVQFIATVSTGTGTPTGTVTFSDGSSQIGTGTLNGAQIATFTTTALAAGPHSIVAAYGGDSLHGSSSSSAVSQVVRSTTASTVTASVSPGVVKAPITFTAHVAQNSGSPASVASAPSGTVVFSDGSTTLGTGTLDANGNATFSTTSLAAGSHSISAAYAGDTYNFASTSPTLAENVLQQQTATTLTASANPAVYGSVITYTATVTITGSGIATGTVTFFDGSTQIGSVQSLNGSGQASINYAGLVSAVHSLSAQYGGDVDDVPSVGTLTETIQKAATSDSLTASPTTVIAGKAFNLTATMADTTGAGISTGNVSFSDSTTSLGSAALNGSGIAAVTPTLGPGAHSLSSSYPGDNNHSGSSGTLSLNVQQATTTIAVTAAPNPSIVGGSVAFTIQVQGNGGVAGGTVTLSADGIALANATLANGSAIIQNATLAVGAHSMTATYAGDTNDGSSQTTQTYTETVQKAAASVSVTGSPNPVVVGNNVTFTAVIHGTTGNPTPSGTVQFVQGGTTLGTSPINGSGTAAISTNTLAPGQDVITANYSGDADYTGASASTTESVQRSTTATLTASVNPALAGHPITFTMQVTGTGTTPSGTITLLDGGSTLAIRSLDGTGTATYQTAALSAGTHTLTASYAGDLSNGPTTSPVLSEQVQQATTTTAISASANPAISGKPLILTAVVSGNGGTPGGRVNFFDSLQPLGTGVLNGSGTATISTAALQPGQHTILASYLGDINDAASTSAGLSVAVQQATTGVVLSGSPNPSVVTRSLVLTAAISGNGGTPTGSVIFRLGSAALATVAVASNGTASFTTSTLALGANSITAAYSGDTDDGASQSTLTEVIQQASPTLALSSTLNPSEVGNAITLAASAVGAAGTATGTVTFLEGGVTLGTAAMGAGGVASFAISSLPLGTHMLTASYAGDVNNAAAQSSPFTQTVQQTTTTQLSTGANPALGGRPLTLSAVVAGANGNQPGGVVVFKDGSATLGTVALAGGSASLQTSALSIGTHALTVVYGGDTLDATSTSAAISEVVQTAGTTVVLSSSGSPALYRSVITFTAVVTGNGASPTGQVSLSEGTQVLGTATVQANGNAVFSLSNLSAGMHTLVASYAGDIDNLPSLSAPLGQTVQAQTTTTITASPPSTLATTPVTLTASVVSNAGTQPGGTISFFDGSTLIGTAGLNANETAILAVATLSSGTHTLSVSYGGDAIDQGSTSAPIIETIQAIPTITHVGISAPSVATGQPFTMIAYVTSNGTAPFTGTVSFSSGSTLIGVSPVNADGTATLAPSLTAASYTVIATYGGDAYNAASSSAPVQFNVSQAADFQLTLTPASLSMATKQNSTVQIKVQSLSGFTDTIGLGCASLPVLVTCTFAKDVVSLASNGSVTVNVTIDTASPLASGGVAKNQAPGGRIPVAFGWLMPGAALFGWALRRRHGRYALLCTWLLAALCTGATILLSGCNGLSSNGAAPGTYVIQITGNGSATGVQHTVDLSLKVTR